MFVFFGCIKCLLIFVLYTYIYLKYIHIYLIIFDKKNKVETQGEDLMLDYVVFWKTKKLHTDPWLTLIW